MAPVDFKSGIRIIDLEQTPETHAHFSKAVGLALDLIARFDPVRYARVKAEIRMIMSVAGIVASNYHRPLRVCAVNLRSFYDAEDPDLDLAVKLLAATFVRDATCGFLISRGIPPTKRNRLRFGNLCCREAQRFMQRLGVPRTAFDPDRLTLVGGWDAWKLAAADVITRDPLTEAAVWKQAQEQKRREDGNKE